MDEVIESIIKKNSQYPREDIITQLRNTIYVKLVEDSESQAAPAATPTKNDVEYRPKSAKQTSEVEAKNIEIKRQKDSDIKKLKEKSNLLAYHYLTQKTGIQNPYGSDTSMITAELGLTFKEAESLVKERMSLITPKNWKLGEKYDTSNLDKQVSDILSQPAQQTSGVKSIHMQPDNVSKILSGEKTTTLRTNNLPSGVYNIGGQQFNLTNRGLLSIEEAGGVEAINKSEAFAQSGPKFSSTKDFLAGKRKLYVYDITPVQPTQQTSELDSLNDLINKRISDVNSVELGGLIKEKMNVNLDRFDSSDVQDLLLEGFSKKEIEEILIKKCKD